METRLIKVDRNGSKHFEGEVTCDRCNGHGYYALGVHNGQPVLSPYDGGVCWKCMGAGKVIGKWIERTPEYEAKLAAQREKRAQAKREKYEREHAEEIAARKAEAERREQERLAREAARRAEIEQSKYFGNVGDKVQAEVTYVRSFSYERTRYGAPWETEVVTGYVWKGDNGETFVWKTTGSIGYKVEVPWDSDVVEWRNPTEHKAYAWRNPDEGERMTIKGTIKAHEEYNEIKQTILTRVKWVH